MNIAWSLRRLNLPVKKSDLVLEVGSGGNPYPRSNVLVDAYKVSSERGWVPLVADRKTVISFGERLPFKDKAFDFVVASHVLEHSPDPENFLSELERVANAGYIETPHAFFERINPYKAHRLEISVQNDVLVIRKKEGWIIDNELVDLYEQRAKEIIAGKTVPAQPEPFHVRFFWQDKIKFSVLNRDVDANWQLPEDVKTLPRDYVGNAGLVSKVRGIAKKTLSLAFMQHRRNRQICLENLLICNKCSSSNISAINQRLFSCSECNTTWELSGNVLDMGEK